MTKINTDGSTSARVNGWEVPPPYVENSELRVTNHVQFLSTWTEIPTNELTITGQEEINRFKQMNYCAYHLSCLYQQAIQSGGAKRQYDEWMQRYCDLKQYLINLNVGLVYDMMNRSRFNLDHDDMSSDWFFCFTESSRCI